MSIYKFRILIDSGEDIFRDIEIKSTQTFEEFHNIILASYQFDNSQMASFYLSDDEWNKGQEIALFDMNIAEEDGNKVLTMGETPINTQINCVGQHLLYTYDFLNMWDFYIELIEIVVKEKDQSYPQIVYKQGDSPLQSSKDNTLSNEDIANEMLASSGHKDDDDTFNDDIFEGFDDFEDYQ